ncbi:hypothetical protein PSTG_10003 [Puccinia striiformis f. sp. tritici PST-78]|uniref:Uncharacterized protein n=1 Tax=Puccinia striiformis f. sp. tritici PST-78 TaxID=1165861 RepID=A0A0L0VBP1_9BASI|nr:hypothetical protein PSTG_10003 [Puccinia striiformis f. sp. tritici PST-78]
MGQGVEESISAKFKVLACGTNTGAESYWLYPVAGVTMFQSALFAMGWDWETETKRLKVSEAKSVFLQTRKGASSGEDNISGDECGPNKVREYQRKKRVWLT